VLVPILFLVGGATVLIALAFAGDEGGPVPDNPPDIVAAPKSAKAAGYDSRWNGKIWKLVDALIPGFTRASDATGIPLGLMVGWVATESGGKIGSAPAPLKGQPDSERGFFQLTPSESARFGLDHMRLSTDPNYSIDAGIKLIQHYAKQAEALAVAPKDSRYFWMLTKLGHTIGSGATKIIVNGAREAGQARSWEALYKHALDNEKKYLSATKHSPTKWFPHVEKAWQIGAPFGFGSSETVVGGSAYVDIVDPLDCLKG
jgi:hypothetical protein